jgi:hypothetical protein
MNRILISLKYGENLSLIDEDELTQDQLLENLSTLFSINNVAILKTSTASVIIRPSDIASIQVEPILNKVIDKPSKEVKPLPKPEPKKTEIVEDIITDID